MTSVRCVRRSRADSLSFSVNSTAESPKTSLLAVARRRGEITWCPFVLPSQPRILTCAADDGPCFASFFPQTRAIYRRVNVGLRDPAAKDRARARARKTERERETERAQDQAISERAPGADRHPAVPASPFLALCRCAPKDGRKFSSSGPSSRLTCFLRRATDSNAATRGNQMTRTEPIGRKSP